MAKLRGKVAVVTGASSGIGEATAEALAAEGASVVAAARREDRLADLTKRIEGDGGKVLAATCDVAENLDEVGVDPGFSENRRDAHLPGAFAAIVPREVEQRDHGHGVVSQRAAERGEVG